MSNIFISYNRESEGIAKALADDVEALGHIVKLDQELSGGQPWWDKILAMIRDCDVFVFVLNPEALNSTACKREYGYAADLGKPILPVLVAEGVSMNLLPSALSKIQFVDYRKQDRVAAISLAKALTSIPAFGPLPDPLPPAPEVPISYLGSLFERIETTSSLSYEEQGTLLIDLKRGLNDSKTTDDARTLLEMLRKRRDLFATVAEEIDEFLGSATKASSAPPRASEKKPTAPERSQKEETLLLPTDRKSPVRQKRGKGAILLAGIGIAAGFLALVINTTIRDYSVLYAMQNSFWYLTALGGAIAGAISGMDQRGIVAALVGMFVPFFLSAFFLSPFSIISGILMLLASPIGAIIGVYQKERRV